MLLIKFIGGNAIRKKLLAEFLGSALLLMAIAGSGMMAVELSHDAGVQLFINAFATILALGVLLFIFAPISGAHFNPAVSLIEFMRTRLTLIQFAGYAICQISGAGLGVILANLMFDHPAISIARHVRGSAGIWLGELIATAGLIFIIQILGQQGRKGFAPVIVASWIGSAYFFTSSTSFANPAVTLARSLTDTFSGIAPRSVSAFIASQIVGAFIGFYLARTLVIENKGIVE